MRRGKVFCIFLCGVLTVSLVLAVGTALAQPVSIDAKTLKKLQETIDQQQLLMQKQTQELKSQSEMLNSLQKQVNDLSNKASEAKTQAAQAQSTAQQASETAQKAATPQPTVTSGQERVKLAVSGQVNRAVNIADDGKNTAAYYVDNDASNSRVRFVGTAKMTDDLTLGSRIEVAFAPDESSQVSQNNESPGDFINERWAEASLASKSYGKISLGKGDTASNNTAEVDLSRTDVVQYASIEGIAGGMLFRQSSGNHNLTAIKVSDAFSDRDGLSRQSRVRYDTPSFYGFSLAGSAVTNQRADAALFWGGQGYGFHAAGAAAISNPNQDNTNYQYDGSFSILHVKTGLNLTVSAGLLDRDNQGDPTNLWIKPGWIANFFDFGYTAFAVDYDRSLNLPTGTDNGYSVGAAVVQSLDKFGTELYLQYRLYSLDRGSNPSVENMNVGTVGARIKF